jgi:hypothetical protein
VSHYVITLVHGTFAPGARWTRWGSRLRDEITRELGADGSTVSFSNPVWSGKNAHEDRRRGSLKLRRCLLRQLRREPDARHFIIAHSHGGNVAMRAVRTSPRLRSRMDGMVTIATPFLLFNRESGRLIFFSKFISLMRRNLIGAMTGFLGLMAARVFLPIALAVELTTGKSWWKRVLLSGGAVAGYAGLFYLAYLSVPWLRAKFPWAFDGPVFVWWLVGGLSLTVVLAALVLYADARSEAFKLLARELVRLRRGLFRRYAYVQPYSGFAAQMRLLVLSSAFDEAQAALSSAWGLQFASRLWATGISLLLLGVSGASLLALVYFGVRLYDYLNLHPMLNDFAEQVMVIACILGAIAMTLVLSLVSGIASGVTERASPGLGFSTRRANLLLSVKAQQEPGGGLLHQYRRYGVTELMRGAEGALFHSRVYSSPCALKHIASWMIGRAEVRTLDSAKLPETSAPVAV